MNNTRSTTTTTGNTNLNSISNLSNAITSTDKIQSPNSTNTNTTRMNSNNWVTINDVNITNSSMERSYISSISYIYSAWMPYFDPNLRRSGGNSRTSWGRSVNDS